MPGDQGSDDELLQEQRDFYDADADSFDHWLASLIDETNDDPVARTYRQGQRRFSQLVEEHAPLGRVLEIAAGTGRLAERYVTEADDVTLLDASPRSLALATERLRDRARVDIVVADVFDWSADGATFDTIVFSAWLHHVPHARFDDFWRRVAQLATPGATVLFDVPDLAVTPPGRTDVPPTPSDDYGFYAPVDGISIRDHFGRRWRVVHNLWDLADLERRLDRLGWHLTVAGDGLFANVRWCVARPAGG